MVIHKNYNFTATTAGSDEIDGVTTVYIADAAGGPYLTLQRSFESKLPEPEDLYIEYGDQSSGSYGSLKNFTLTKRRVVALVEGGISIQIDLQIGDEEWNDLEAGFEKLLEGLEPFIQRH